jgi:GT2 family glycosyltransferase
VKVSFIIPTYNRSKLLAAALESIRAQTMQPFEILVVDNGSTDDTVTVAERDGARMLQMYTNRGFSFAVNRGIEAAQGELLAIVNNDVELEPYWLERLAAPLRVGSAWFAIGKLLQYSDRSMLDGAGDAICRGGASWRLGHGRANNSLFDTPRSTFFPSLTAVVVRRALFERAGKLDEMFYAYLEDVDLGLRAALLGMCGQYIPGAVAYHRGSATLGAWSPQMVEWLTRNQILLLAKHYPGALAARFWRAILAAQVLWGAAAVRRGRTVAYTKGFIAALRAAPTLRRDCARTRNGNKLAKILSQSETELVRAQRALGWDRYWRWYCRLAPKLEECPR